MLIRSQTNRDRVSACQCVPRLLAIDHDLLLVLFACLFQVRCSLQSALSAGHDFIEIQFPVAGLTSVPGDADGNTEHNLCAKYLRQIINGAFIGADISGVKVIFPDKTELKIALEGAEPDPSAGQW